MKIVYAAAIAAGMVLGGCAAAPPPASPKEVQVNFRIEKNRAASTIGPGKPADFSDRQSTLLYLDGGGTTIRSDEHESTIRRQRTYGLGAPTSGGATVFVSLTVVLARGSSRATERNMELWSRLRPAMRG